MIRCDILSVHMHVFLFRIMMVSRRTCTETLMHDIKHEIDLTHPDVSNCTHEPHKTKNVRMNKIHTCIHLQHIKIKQHNT